MGSITTGVGLMSGIDTANLIEQLLALESRGKTRLQNRIATLQSQQSAMMDINSRLLSLKNIANSFKSGSIFRAATAQSSNEEILTASAGSAAHPGNYTFTVQQLVSNSQKLSRGFADADSAPIGMTELSLDFGLGRVNRDRPLDELNGGEGVRHGNIIITDQAGNTATINLTDVVSLGEVLDRINGSHEVSVEARLEGDRIVIHDTSGGVDTLTVSNAIGYSTADDLGITASSSEGTITGSNINFIAGHTSLASFNDGTGVLIRNNVSDLTITDRTGATHHLDLGRINADITETTALSELNNGEGVTISDDFDNPDIKFVARDGTEYEVNLTGLTNVGGLISRVNSETGGHIQLSIADGNRLTVTDTVGGAGPLKVEGAGELGEITAEELGILNSEGVSEDSFDGESIPNTITAATVNTIDELIARIEEQTEGAITAAVHESGTRLTIIDNTGGGENLIIRSTAGNPHLAHQLGIATGEDGVAESEITGQRLIADLGSVLIRHLNGGNGLDGADTIDITDRAGNQLQLSGLGDHQSLSEIVKSINEAAEDQGVGITVRVSDSGTALLIEDTTGSSTNNLVISGDAATALGIEADVASNAVRGSHLHHQYVTEASLLSDLNYGRGVLPGSFRITDGLGNASVVNITSDHKTLYDVIQAINSRPTAITARINDTGDGIILEPDEEELNGQTPFVAMKVESVSGSTARDLNIAGTAGSVEDASINGSYRHTFEFDETATLSQIVSELNSAKIPLSASIINSGSGSTPFRLNLTSEISGRAGDLVIDTGEFDLGLTTLTKAQDAKVFFGDPAQDGSFLITSSTNSVQNVVPGVTLDLKKASNEPVSVQVDRDVDGVVNEVGSFVEAFNDAIAKIDEYDFFDIDSEERGILLGNATTARVRASLFRTVRQTVEGVDGQYQRLRDVGVRVGQGGQLEFDEQAFREAYEDDPESARELFAANDVVDTPPEEILPGVTVGGSGQTVMARGIGVIFDDLLDNLTDPIDGTLKLADRNFEQQINLVQGRVEAFDNRLENRRKQLERQFMAMENSLAKLQTQSESLMALQTNMLMSAMR